MGKRAIVIGSGFAGLSAASFMAKAGWDVTVLEKLGSPGGRARQFSAAGFTFDMGPSWYWMPDVFERYFAQFGKTVDQYYTLDRLDPSYRVYWDQGPMDIPAGIEPLQALFESLEPGSAAALEKFLAEAEYKYRVGVQKLVFKPGQSYSELLDWEVIRGVFRLEVFTSMSKHVHKYFKDPRLRQLLEFPVLFLGAMPEKTPALYSLMNYADMVGGTWYPQGGMYRVVQAMYELALELGVKFHFDTEVTGMDIRQGRITGVNSPKGEWAAEVVIGGADYHFIEQQLLPPEARSYSEKYWDTRVMAPSCLIYYLGLDKKLPGMRHHTLFFDVPFSQHSQDIYTSPKWPEQPLFYTSAPSVTDPGVAPAGQENLFLLVPVAAGLGGDTEVVREHYLELITHRMEKHLGTSVRDSIIYQRAFSERDFTADYHSYKGNAYGLANTLMQTSVLKPGCRSKKISNLFYTGQLTVPGPGVPPCLISGEVVAGEVERHFGNRSPKIVQREL